MPLAELWLAVRNGRAPLLAAIVPLLLAGTASADPTAAMLAAGRVDDAISALQQRIAASADDAEAYHLLCRSYCAYGDVDRAVPACERAVALVPDNSSYHLWLGSALGFQADRASFLSAIALARRTRAELERAVELDGRDIEARCSLAEFYVEAPAFAGGGGDKAKLQAAALATRAPARSHWILGRIAAKKNDTSTAEAELRAAVEGDHSNAAAWRDLIVLYRHTEQWDRMQSTAAHLADAGDAGADALLETADALISAGRDLPLAIKLLQQALSSPPVEEAPAFAAHQLLGAAFEAQGDREGAVREYRAALAQASNAAPAREGLQRLSH